jgi:FtsP/CotA-like multicopper oxidase with cupredoxin domain
MLTMERSGIEWPPAITYAPALSHLPPHQPNVTVRNCLNPNLGVRGKEYVWHCHILEHEEHDMMRPIVIT